MKRLLFLLVLLSFVSHAQVLNEHSVFEGDTKYQFSGETANICWTPPVTDWQGVFVFDLQVRHYERKEIVVDRRAINSITESFIIPRTGHYEILVRTCKQDEPTVCSPWASSAQGAGSAGRCVAGASTPKNWWLFAWVAAPTFPE